MKLRNLLIVFMISVLCIGCDQVTKEYARQQLVPGARSSVLGGVLHLQYELNTGGMLSLGADLSPEVRFWIFTVGVGSVLILLFVIASFSSEMHWMERAAFALIVGGGLGNLIDRITCDGAVVDFLNIGVGTLRTGIFNLADVVVLIGAGMLMARLFQLITAGR